PSTTTLSLHDALPIFIRQRSKRTPITHHQNQPRNLSPRLTKHRLPAFRTLNKTILRHTNRISRRRISIRREAHIAIRDSTLSSNLLSQLAQLLKERRHAISGKRTNIRHIASFFVTLNSKNLAHHRIPSATRITILIQEERLRSAHKVALWHCVELAGNLSAHQGTHRRVR